MAFHLDSIPLILQAIDRENHQAICNQFGIIWLYYATRPLHETLVFSAEDDRFRREVKYLFGKRDREEYRLSEIVDLKQEEGERNLLPHLVIKLRSAERSQSNCHLFNGLTQEISETHACIYEFLEANKLSNS